MNDNQTLNYSIPIENNDTSSQVIEHLKLANRNGQYYGYILQHEPASLSYLGGFDQFTGIVRMLDLDGMLLSREFIFEGVQQSNVPDSLITNQRMTDVENCEYVYRLVAVDMYDGTGSGTGSATYEIVGIICDAAGGGENGGTDSGGDGWGTPIDGGPLGGDGGTGGSSTGGDGPGDTFGFDDEAIISNIISYYSQPFKMTTMQNSMDKDKYRNSLRVALGIPVFKKMLQELMTSHYRPSVSLNASIETAGSFDPNGNTITFRSRQDINVHTVLEEFFHAYQHNNIGLGKIVNSHDKKGFANIEFEAKLFHDILMKKHLEYLLNNYVAVVLFGNVSNEYDNWLNDVTNNGEFYPSNFSSLGGVYFYYLQSFLEYNPHYSSPIDNDLYPTTMFKVFGL